MEGVGRPPLGGDEAELIQESAARLQRQLREPIRASWLRLQIAEIDLSAVDSKQEQDRCGRALALTNRPHLEAISSPGIRTATTQHADHEGSSDRSGMTCRRASVHTWLVAVPPVISQSTATGHFAVIGQPVRRLISPDTMADSELTVCFGNNSGHGLLTSYAAQRRDCGPVAIASK